MEKLVQVVGRAKLNVPPDSVEFRIRLDTTNKNYQELLKDHQDQKNQLIHSLVNNDFYEKNLKTSSFEIHPVYKYENGENVFDTYQAQEQMVLKIDNQSELIQRVLTSIEDSLVPVTFQMQYTVEDTDAWKKELLTSAMNNAYQEAEILVESVGKKVGELLQMTTSNENLNFYSPTIYEARVISNQMNPQDIELTSQVNVTWEIR